MSGRRRRDQAAVRGRRHGVRAPEADIPLAAYAGVIATFSSIGAAGWRSPPGAACPSGSGTRRPGTPVGGDPSCGAAGDEGQGHERRAVTVYRVRGVGRSRRGRGARPRARRAEGGRRAPDLPVLHRPVDRARGRHGCGAGAARDRTVASVLDGVGGLGLPPGRASRGVAEMRARPALRAGGRGGCPARGRRGAADRRGAAAGDALGAAATALAVAAAALAGAAGRAWWRRSSWAWRPPCRPGSRRC